ncbi:MAG: hypothetical protein WC480_01265 [Patescibacteria group bacterium]
MSNKSLIISLVVLSLVISGGAMAADNANVNANSAKDNIKKKVEELRDNVCKNTESRIAIRATRYKNNKERHAAVHNQIREKIQKLISRLQAKGYDVAKLNEDLATLDSKISKFGTDYEIYINQLTATQGYICGQSEGKFIAALKEANTYLKLVHQDSLDIRLFYQQTIRPDILALKEQIKAALPETGSVE